MTTSILNDVMLLRNDPLSSIKDYFHKINVLIFDDLFSAADTAHLEARTKDAILYILIAYSEDSPLIVLRQDDKVEKENICEYLNIPEVFRHDLIHLVDTKVRQATTRYVTDFAGALFRAFSFMKIQYNDYELAITNRSFSVFEKEDEKDKLKWDMKEHAAAVKEMGRLGREIERIEKDIKASIKRFDGLDDIVKYKGKQKLKNNTSVAANVERSIVIKN